MDVACDDRYHCKQTLGFFVKRNGEAKSPQFSIVSNVNQNGCVVVAPIDGSDFGVRLVLVHQDKRRRGRVLGFTSERNEKVLNLEYFFAGVIPFGKILLIPVEGHDRIEDRRPDCPYEDYVTVFQEVDGSLRYTQKAENALEYLFEVLDGDNNGFLSASEMSVFKEFLGLGHDMAEDEWSDALFGWQEGDLDCTLTEMSFSFFKTFIVRLCQGYFSFAEPWTAQQEHPYLMTNRSRRIKNLERILECFGFDKDLLPGISRYRFDSPDVYNLNFTVIPRERMTAEKAVSCITRIFGKKRSSNRGLTLYTLQCSDWFSLLVKNYNAEPKEVIIEYCIVTSSGGILLSESTSSWRKVLPGDSETLAGRLSIIRGSCDDFVVHCDVLYGTESGMLKRVSLT